MARKIMLQAHRNADLGFEMTRLPHHVSLKQPFKIAELDAIEKYFDEFTESISPIMVHYENTTLWSSQVFGYESGVMALKAAKTKELYELHNRLNNELNNRFGSSHADFDGDDYTFHMTIAIGGKPFSNYQKA